MTEPHHTQAPGDSQDDAEPPVAEMRRGSCKPDDPVQDIQTIRERMLNVILYALVIFIILSLVAEFMRASQEGWTVIPFIYLGLGVTWAMAAIFSHRIPYHTRLNMALGPMFLAGVVALVTMGLSGGGIPLLLGTVVISTVLGGRKWGIVSIILCLSVIVIVGVGMISGSIPISVETMSNSTKTNIWIGAIGVFLLMSTTIVISAGTLQKHLEKTILAMQEQNRLLVVEVTERKQAEKRIEHLNSVLKAIRNVNQLIVVETDRDILLQKACDTLVEARSYEAAWLGLLENGESFVMVKGSGFKENMSHFSEHVVSGIHPPCIKKMLAGNDMFTIVEKSRECVDCPFKDACSSQEVMISRVEHSGRLYGLLAVSITSDIGISKDDEQLLTEVSADIGLALYKMEIEEAHKKIREELQDSEERLSQIVSTNPIPTFVIDMDHTVTHWNKACENLTGVSASKVVGTNKVWPYFYPDERPVMVDLIADEAFEQDIASYYKGGYNKSALIEGAYEAEGFFPDVGESGKWLFFTASSLKDRHGKVIGAIEIFQDITQRKQDEEILSNVNAELEERVAKRTAELEEKNAELEHMNKLFVGRELRMAELKKQIAKLEKDAEPDKKAGDKTT